MQQSITHKFALGVSKNSEDGKTWQVRVASKCEGITLEESIFFVEGWLDKVKSELKKKHFGQLEFRSEDDNKP